MDRGEWIRGHWRPLLAITYILVIVFDFIIAPAGWSIIQMIASGNVTQQWEPITLLSGGLFHLSMGAILGVTSYTRGQEKIEKARADAGIGK